MSTTAKLRASVVVIAVALLASTALGVPMLQSIGALEPGPDGAVESKVYAMSPDGTWVVGGSNGKSADGTMMIPQAIVWSAGSGLVQLPNTGGLATSARGVVVKANGDLGVAGYAYNAPTTLDNRMASYTVAPANLTGGTWVIAAGTSNQIVGTYNAARMYGTDGNEWSIAGRRSNGGRAIQARVVANSYSDSGTLAGYNPRVYNVSSRVPTGSGRGFAAGYETNTTTLLRRAFFGVTGSTQTVIPGSAGYQSEVLGMSPDITATAGSGVIVGYDQDMSASNFKHAFYYPQGAAGMLLLSELAGDNQGEAIDVRIVGSNTIIGGYSSDGITEKAVIWTNGTTPSSLAGILAGAGVVNLSDWTSLSRITSMSDDGLTVAGWGVWAADGSTRGFVATIPEPATLSLLGLGACVLFRRRK